MMLIKKVALALFLIAALLAACAVPGAAPQPTQTGTAPGGSTTQGPSQPVSSEDPTQTGEAPHSPLDPIPGEENMVRGPVDIASAEVVLLESFPVQVSLNLKGALPTPCHQLRAKVSGPDDQKRINVEVYSLVDPDKICIQMLEPFETSINLGSFPSGTYSVWVNGEKVGDITV
jgi:hypothetical protein